MRHASLEAFAEWFMNGSILARVPHDAPSHMLDGVTAITLCRSAQYQVQMFAVPANHIIPEHYHPNVDSIEIYVGGDLRFSLAGRFLSSREIADTPTGTGVSMLRGMRVRVHPGDLHGGVCGPHGGVFYSIQQWLNGVKPTCVASDYVGIAMGPQHLASILGGTATLKDHLSPADAAALEGLG